MTDQKGVRAYRVTCNGIGDGIYFAETASQAKMASLLAGREAGYAVQFRHLRVRRAPEFDRRTYLGKQPNQGIAPEYFDAEVLHGADPESRGEGDSVP